MQIVLRAQAGSSANLQARRITPPFQYAFILFRVLISQYFPSLETYLQGQLYLPRRTGFTRRESRARDAAKGRSADEIARSAKVRMVKEVEQFGSEFRAHPVAELGVLDDRKICVVKSRPDDHVAAEVAEPRDRSKYSSVEPAVYAADDVDRTGHVGPARV